MDFQSIFARVVAVIGAGAIAVRHRNDPEFPQAMGGSPTVPPARDQGKIPTLKMPSAKGWSEGQTPQAAAGLKVNCFASGLVHPRSLRVLENGDVLTAEALFHPGGATTVFDLAKQSTMKRAAAIGVSPNRVTLLRDTEGTGTASHRSVLLKGLRQPFGVEVAGNKLYVGNTDSVDVYDFTLGQDTITTQPKVLMTMRGEGHWTRNLILNSEQNILYVAVGSLSNIAEMGMDVEKDRAAILALDLNTGEWRSFAAGLRNPVGIAWEPTTNKLWTVVNERDGLGDETPPDYLTSVIDGGFYGWPYCYWNQIVDERVPQEPAMVAKAITPDYALGGHTASLGLCWMPAGILPGYGDGMVIGQHGSWNRSKLSGYKVIHVPFSDGKPSGAPKEILTGFLAPDEKHSYGRPVGVAIGKDNSLLVADDVGNAIWRVTGA